MIKNSLARIFGITTNEKVYKINGVPVKVKYSTNRKVGQSSKVVKVVVQDIPKSKKDKYVLSSIYPNEEVMRRVDRILLDANS